MKKMFKSLLVASALAAASLTGISASAAGERYVLVAEFWTGEARVCGHRCTQRRGLCDAMLVRADEAQAVATDCFFALLDADALEAVHSLDDDSSGCE